MRHPGTVLSREQIEDQIWNYEYAGSSNNVDGYLSRLRKKIDEGRGRSSSTPSGAWAGPSGPPPGEGPMKRRSVQVRLTLWYTLLMAGMAGLLLVFLLVISGAVSPPDGHGPVGDHPFGRT